MYSTSLDHFKELLNEIDNAGGTEMKSFTKSFEVMKNYKKYFPDKIDLHKSFNLPDDPLTLKYSEDLHSKAVLNEEKLCLTYRLIVLKQGQGPQSRGSTMRPAEGATRDTTYQVDESTHVLALGTEFVLCFASDVDLFDVHVSGGNGKKLMTGLKDVEKVNVVIIPSFSRNESLTHRFETSLKNPQKNDLVIFIVRESEFTDYVTRIKELDDNIKKQVACFSLPPGQYGPGHCKYWSVEIAKKFSLGWFALMDDSIATIKVGGSTVKEGSTVEVQPFEVSVFQALALIKDARPLATEDSKEKVVCVGGIAGREKYLQLNFTHARVNQLLFLNGTILKSKQIVFSPLAPLMEDMLFQYKCVAVGLYVLKAKWLVFWAGRGEKTGGMHSADTHQRVDTPTPQNTPSHQDTTPTRQVLSIGYMGSFPRKAT